MSLIARDGVQPGNIVWWLAFTMVCVWAQHFVPGVDFLVAGLILSLQEERRNQTWWLVAFWILVQEGGGSLAFGSSLLWYGMAVVLFMIGRWLFEARNALFILLLALALGGWHFALVQMMTTLQESVVLAPRLLLESGLQAVLLLPAWFLAARMRLRMFPEARV